MVIVEIKKKYVCVSLYIRMFLSLSLCYYNLSFFGQKI